MLKCAHEKPWYFSTLVSYLEQDVPAAIGIPVADARDIHTLERRLADEGESFFTKTLPAFAKSVDLALQGHTPLTVSGFRKRNPRSALPAFLQALLKRVFKDDGWVLDEPCLASIRAIRQLCLWGKKIEKGFNDESLQQAELDFIKVDEAIPEISANTDPGLLGRASAVVSLVLGRCPGLGRLLPAHGPGAVAGGEDVKNKRRFDKCYPTLERMFRPIPTFYSLRDASEDPQRILGRQRCDSAVVRICFVEKDSSGPRTIGLEPKEYMWCQQAIKRWMYSHIEKHSLAKGQINFTDQSVNQELTSSWADYDTLDMSKASDRNSLQLVRLLFAKTRLLPYLEACRTPAAVLPSGRLHWFKKFAPMGSAVCFPVQSLVYYALAVATLHIAGVPFLTALKNVYVYGDDLVTPHGFFPQLTRTFESVGLKFNAEKCCTHGKFRESCGRDAYDGEVVTPLRMRKVYPTHDASSFVPVIEHANQLMRAGHRASARSFRKAAEDAFPNLRKLHLPTYARDDLPILYWLDYESQTVLSVKIQDGLAYIRGWALEPIAVRANPGDDWRYLRESLSRGGPVGALMGSTEERFRTFDKRWASRLRKKRFIIEPLSSAPTSFEPVRGLLLTEAGFIRRPLEGDKRMIAWLNAHCQK